MIKIALLKVRTRICESHVPLLDIHVCSTSRWQILQHDTQVWWYPPPVKPRIQKDPKTYYIVLHEVFNPSIFILLMRRLSFQCQASFSSSSSSLVLPLRLHTLRLRRRCPGPELNVTPRRTGSGSRRGAGSRRGGPGRPGA